MSSAILFDPADPSVRDDPFPVYARLRAEDPVHWSPALKSWVLSRYCDVQRMASAPEQSVDRLTPFYKALPSSEVSRVEDILRYLRLWLVFRDPPDHTRLRRPLARAFTPTALEALKPNIAAITELLLERLAEKSEADLVSDFALPLPAYVIMDLLGVPRDRLADMRRWSEAMRLFIGSARRAPDKYQRAREGVVEMAACFRALIGERRREPRRDVLTTLIATDMGEDELIASAMLFLFAGHETTTSLIAGASLMLLRDPDARARLIAGPALAHSAVEEFLRYDGPTIALVRVAAADHAIEGRPFRTGERVIGLIGAANRDPAEFTHPDRLDLARTPNRHLTFGYGLHFCLGAPLARLEGQFAIPALHRRFPGMRLIDASPHFVDSIVLRGPVAVPVSLGKAA